MILALSTLARPSAAQEQLAVGDGPAALPAAHRVGLIDGAAHRLTLSGSAGYGYTESVLGGEDRHHRIGGTLALSYSPLPWLVFGFSQQLRTDRHVGPPDDGDSGSVFEPRVHLRFGWQLPRGVSLGLDAALWLPASDSGAGPGAGASVDMSALLGFRPGELPLMLSLQAGYRLDRSAEGARNADSLSLSDRLSLGVSDAQAILLGFAALYRLGAVALFAEWSWDLLVGDEAPSAGQSPMRLAGGARWWPLEALQVQLVVEASPSARPQIARGEPLVVVEPRVAVLLGLTGRIGFGSADRPTRSRQPLQGVVVGEGVGPIEGARVVVTGGRRELEAVTDSSGGFELEDPRADQVIINVEAETWLPGSVTFTMNAANSQPVRVVLQPEPGSLVGRVETTSQTPVEGVQITLDTPSGAREASCDADGRFTLEGLSPGPATIEARAAGYRQASVEAQIVRGQQAEVTLTLERALPEGQLRGEVRAIGGESLRAIVGIEPGERRLNTDSEGNFEVNLPPGQYRVRVYVSGYQLHSQNILVEQDGVVLLNVELRPSRRRRRR